MKWKILLNGWIEDNKLKWVGVLHKENKTYIKFYLFTIDQYICGNTLE